MSILKKIGIVSCLLVFTACGKDGDGSGSSESWSGYSPGSTNSSNGGACGSEVISDYNTYVLRCKYMTTTSDARNCKSTAQSLLSKYPNLNCTASQSSSSSINSTTVRVTASSVQSVIDQLTAMGI